MTKVKHIVKESWRVENFELTFSPVEDSIMIEEIKDKNEKGKGEKYKVKYLTFDTDASNPREEWDNLGTMVCFHGRYINLGDKTSYRSSDFNGWDELEEKIREDNDVAAIYPVYMYDHSGVRVSIEPFGDRWDSGQIGFIFVSKEKVQKEFGDVSDESVMKASMTLKGEVEVYDQYLSGDVYCIVVEKYDENKEGFDFDIVGGYYGYKYALEQLKEE